MSLASRLYHGEVHYDFIGRRRRWYALSGIVLLICIVSLVVRGFTLGIDFKGGTSFQFPERGQSISTAKDTVARASGVDAGDLVAVELATTKRFQIQTPPLTDAQTTKTETALVQKFKITTNDISIDEVGSSWGSSVTKKALEGLVVFLVVVVLYISVRFEPKMAVAAIVALIHDLLVTAGIYSLVGFEVTPSTVIAVLTILGFSLYDTVVVFDKVRENTAGLSLTGRRTYAGLANDAVDQTLMRSINTSLIALLPVGSLLFIGAGLLGAGTLKDLALAQFVGLASGAYSSIFVATPILVDLKEREPPLKQLHERVARQQASAARDSAPEAAVATAGAAAATAAPTRPGLRKRTAVLDRDDGAGGAGPEENRYRSAAYIGSSPPSEEPEPPGADDEPEDDTAAAASAGARPRQGPPRSNRPGAAGSRANKRSRQGRSGGKRRR